MAEENGLRALGGLTFVTFNFNSLMCLENIFRS